MKKLGAFVLAGVLLASFATAHFDRTFDPHVQICRWPYSMKAAFILSCDDISAGYPLEYFEEIQSTLNDHSIKATFFVIPNHGEWDLLTDSPLFVKALHTAEESGHEIGLHGYAHYEDEFVCPPEQQRQLLRRALSIMKEAGFTVKGFRAPCLKTTPDTLKILKEYNFIYDSSTFSESGDISFEGDLPEIPSGFEYSWYVTEKDLSGNLARAKMDFLSQYEKGSVFSFFIHMKAANEGEGMKFLESFLDYIEKKEVWNFTLLELVEWELQLQNVRLDIQKTVTGGEITGHNIPEGLVTEIRLPSNYHVKNLTEGAAVTIRLDGSDNVFTVTFEQSLEKCVLSFILDPLPVSGISNECLILCGSDSDNDSSPNAGYADMNLLQRMLDAWEIDNRVVVVDHLSEQLLNSSIILVDRTYLKRTLTLQEKLLLYSLEDRVIIFSGFEPLFVTDLFLFNKKTAMEYVALPMEIPISKYKGYYDLGYYRMKILKGKSTYVYIKKLRADSPRGLYCNLLVRSLFITGQIPIRQPFLSLEIDDCAMYETKDKQGNKIVTNFQAYTNSLALAHSYNLTPIYGFTTSYFPENPEIHKIFSFLKRNKVLVANHGYEHSLDFADPEKLAHEIFQANADIAAFWGEPPKIVLVPSDTMDEKSMVKALADTPIKAVGTLDKGYTFGVCEPFHEILFYERTSLQLCSKSVDNVPPFKSLFLYSRPFLPSMYVVTHIFNYIKKESAYQYIRDALTYLMNTGYQPSDTETMTEEDFFWSFVDLKSSRSDELVIGFSGLENLPRKEYTIHFMISGSSNFVIAADFYNVEYTAHHTGDITFVTVTLRPEVHSHKWRLPPEMQMRIRKKRPISFQ